MEIKTGIRGRSEAIVSAENTAKSYGSGFLDVFSTPHLVALMEEACHSSLVPYMEEGTDTVGTKVELAHLAATPIGMKVWAESTLTKVDGRMLEFEVKAYDDAGLIGEGTHQRFIIKPGKFMAKAAEKLANRQA